MGLTQSSYARKFEYNLAQIQKNIKLYKIFEEKIKSEKSNQDQQIENLCQQLGCNRSELQVGQLQAEIDKIPVIRLQLLDNYLIELNTVAQEINIIHFLIINDYAFLKVLLDHRIYYFQRSEIQKAIDLGKSVIPIIETIESLSRIETIISAYQFENQKCEVN
jgi:hypothetical protein